MTPFANSVHGLGLRQCAAVGQCIPSTIGRRHECRRKVARLTITWLATDVIGIAADGVLCAYAGVDDVSLDKDSGSHDVLIGAQDSEIRTIRRCHVRKSTRLNSSHL